MDTAGQLMEFSFDNLRFSDVLERADFSLKRVDTVLDFIKGRAAAEKGYAKSIKELGTVHSGLLKNFEGLWGNKSPSSEPTDRSTLEAAIDATRDNMKQTAALREARVAGLEALAARLVDLRSRHQTSVKAYVRVAGHDYSQELVPCLRCLPLTCLACPWQADLARSGSYEAGESCWAPTLQGQCAP